MMVEEDEVRLLRDIFIIMMMWLKLLMFNPRDGVLGSSTTLALTLGSPYLCLLITRIAGVCCYTGFLCGC